MILKAKCHHLKSPVSGLPTSTSLKGHSFFFFKNLKSFIKLIKKRLSNLLHSKHSVQEPSELLNVPYLMEIPSGFLQPEMKSLHFYASRTARQNSASSFRCVMGHRFPLAQGESPWLGNNYKTDQITCVSQKKKTIRDVT